jgi:uncharacterized cupin superfamily protein
MIKVKLQDVPEEERLSPKGAFHVRQKDISLALGGIKNTGPFGGGHPFDVCEVTVPAGKTNWPFHYHSAQWELFIVKEGRGLVRTANGESEIETGDAFLQKPGNPHQIRNPGEKDLVLLVIADNPPSDVVGFPNTGQWLIKPAGKLLGGDEKPFYAGEE